MDANRNRNAQHEASAQRVREREEARRQIEEGAPRWVETTGIMSVVSAARDVEFPQGVEDLVRDVGDREVVTSEGVRMPLARILERIAPRLDPARDGIAEDGSFPSLRDFQTAVQRHWGAVEFLELPEEQRPGGGGRRGGAAPGE